MTFDEFQRRRAILSHNVLKNGIIMRLPADSVQYILRTPTVNGARAEVKASRPMAINGNMREAGRTWVEGVEGQIAGVIESLTELLDAIPQVTDFRKGSGYDELRERLLRAANACTPVLTLLRRGSAELTDTGWAEFLVNLKLVVQSVDAMRGGHPDFQKWMAPTVKYTPNF